MFVRVFIMLLISVAVSSAAETGLPKVINYNRHIRPILSDTCFRCHGPDAETREAGLRFDVRESAIKKLASDKVAIQPGDSGNSELLRRINSTDPDTLMPPAASNKHLSERDRQLLKLWIEQGAEYHPHWAFEPLVRSAVPPVKDAIATIRNPIDAFVAARLVEEGLAMSPVADKTTLIRRVSLDLSGLPPTLAEVDAFLKDDSPEAYEKVVDRLLASPRYAERMAMNWLDLARYADTHGYNNDGERKQWPWRDWVINAFHTNMPYDQFITEQLAGDLLENATIQQRLATAFGRNHVITSEGGIIEEEYRVEYVADRVHTTATVFLGLSLQCARCHDHKFDPISQRDYYRFFAFFNNVPEKILNYNKGFAAAPFIQAPSPFQSSDTARLEQDIINIEKSRVARASQIEEPLAIWLRDPANLTKLSATPVGLLTRLSLDEAEGNTVRDAVESTHLGTIHGNVKWTAGKFHQALEFDGKTHVDLGQLVEFEHDKPFSISAWVFPTSLEPSTVISKIDDNNAYRGFDLIIEQGKPAMHIVSHWPDNGLKVIAKQPLSLNAWHHVLATYDGSKQAAGVTIYVDGVATPLEATNDKLRDSIKTEQPVRLGQRSASVPFHGKIDEVQLYANRLTADDAKQLESGQELADLSKILAIPAADRNPAQQAQLRNYYLEKIDEPHRALSLELAEKTKQRAEHEKAFPETMVMEEMPQPRPAFLLKRGQYDQPGEPVSAGVLENLLPLPTGSPANRLGLAKWLVDPKHPLTARVTVNRWWQMLFGTGIVETVEDFGSQGAWPTNPELLDWLAMELISSGWNVKQMQKLMVMSATYRQTSRVTPALHERDPKNQLLARGSRFRLPAETIRDNALAISGLLVNRLGGPSVKPYQPDGLWQDVSVERSAVYKEDDGDNLYRRSMYTFWKRTCPPPSLSTFDAPDRETCLIRRARTNTPLQALVLMNDPTYVEASRKLAESVLLEGGETAEARLNHAFRVVLAREARPAERQVLLPMIAESISRFRSAPQQADKLLAVGKSSRNKQLDPIELAAWSTLASVLLSLDETISKE
jgi:hypothetical protein